MELDIPPWGLKTLNYRKTIYRGEGIVGKIDAILGHKIMPITGLKEKLEVPTYILQQMAENDAKSNASDLHINSSLWGI